MGEDPEATYAALAATYAPRNPFREFARAQITLNELRILIKGLPPDSAMHRATRGHEGWDVKEYLAAEQVNALRWLGALFIAKNSEKGEITEPEWVETPRSAAERAQAEEERQTELEEIRDWWGSEIENQLNE